MLSGINLWTSTQHLNSIKCLLVSLNGGFIFSGSADNTVKTVDSTKCQLVANYQESTDIIKCIVINNKCTRL